MPHRLLPQCNEVLSILFSVCLMLFEVNNKMTPPPPPSAPPPSTLTMHRLREVL